MANVVEYRQKYYPFDYPAPIDGTPILAQMVKDRLPVKGIVVDIGAGKGNAFHPCRKPGITLIGIDESRDVKYNQHLNEYVVQSADHLPFEDHSIEFVFSDFTFEHMKNPRGVLSEISRVLKRGGFLVFRTVNLFHYVAVCSILTPDALRDDVIRLSGRKPADCFTAFYRLNNTRKIIRALRRNSFKVDELARIEGPPDYLGFSRLLYRLGVAYERVANSSERLAILRSNILVAARRL